MDWTYNMQERKMVCINSSSGSVEEWYDFEN